MNAPTRPLRRGQPVIALTLVLASWVGGRVLTWRGDVPVQPVGTAVRPVTAQTPALQTLFSQVAPPRAAPLAPVPLAVAPPVAPPAMASAAPVAQPVAPGVTMPHGVPQRITAGHQTLWNMEQAQAPMRDSGGATPAIQSVRPKQPRAEDQHRWSMDAWLLLRRGGNGFNLPGAGLPGANLPTGAYGASQAGAVIRYRLARASANRPTLYLRASTAWQAPRGEEIAAGFAARPLAHLPISTMVEVRATRTTTGTVIRPAAAMVTELPPIDLPLALRAEVYAQAGYVGGSGATAFVDGQARLDRGLIGTKRATLRAGAAAWGGAQNGAQRLDVGPSATLGVPIGPVNGRVAVDWRFRVAGNAAPTSGPAITLSAGF